MKKRFLGSKVRVALGSCWSLIALSTVVVTVSACGGGIETQPLRASKESLIQVSEMDFGNGSEASSTEASDEPSETSTAPSAEDAASNRAIPEVLYPNGVETTLTPPGTKLEFGESAVVASSDADGRLLVWSITAYSNVPIPSDQVSVAPVAADAGDRKYFCFAYDISYLGVVAGISNDNGDVPGVVNPSDAAVVPPLLIPGTSEGQASPRLVGGADAACGIPHKSRLPVAQDELLLNSPYARGIVAASRSGASSAQQPATLMYKFDHGIPGVTGAAKDPDPIIWR